MIQQVSAGIIKLDNHLLISKRQKHQLMDGYWELPGGKCEKKELPIEALEREINEEVGIQIRQASLAYSIGHHYPHGFIQLHVFNILRFTQTPRGNEGQLIHWQPIASINQPPFTMLPAGLKQLKMALMAAS
ncbi:MAG: (deoxy)nucleoside triphosphate pyrophosphohydrolase [Candidatus Comchoanobacterales bacterium]